MRESQRNGGSNGIFYCLAVCNGIKMGHLKDVISINASNIDSFLNCTKINGDVSIVEVSLKG